MIMAVTNEEYRKMSLAKSEFGILSTFLEVNVAVMNLLEYAKIHSMINILNTYTFILLFDERK